MPLPQIAVEVAAPAGVADRDRGGCELGSGGDRSAPCNALLEACTAAAGAAACTPADADGEAAITIRVRWRGRGGARIEVVDGLSLGRRGVRDLVFAPSDAAVEKWRSVGYAVGTLASEIIAGRSPAGGEGESEPSRSGGVEGASPAAESSSSPPSADEAASQATAAASKNSPTPTPKPSPETEVSAASAIEEADVRGAPSRREQAWSAEAGALLGPSNPALRVGGFVRASRAFGAPFITVALAYSSRAEDSRGVGAAWISPSAGAGWGTLASSWLSFHARVEAVLEHRTVRIDEPGSGRTDSRSGWIGGFRMGVELGTFPGAIGPTLGAEGTLRTHGTDIQVGPDVTGAIPAVDYAFLAGLRAEWP